MSKYKSDQQDARDTPKYPPVCSRVGCKEFTDVVLAVVIDAKGNHRSGPAAEFGSNKENGYTISSDYQFIEWISRCANHYLEDMIMLRRVKYVPIKVPSEEMTDEQREDAREHFVTLARKLTRGGKMRTEENIESGKWTKAMEEKHLGRAAVIGMDIGHPFSKS